MTNSTALTIAGSDSSGGAGIQADLKTMTSFKVYGMSAITAITAQNTTGVQSVVKVEPDVLKAQIESVCDDIKPDAVKIGMIGSLAQAEVITECLKRYDIQHIVIDPVMISTSGTALMGEDALEYIRKNLFPLAEVITPNIPEAEVLSGKKIKKPDDMEKVGRLLCDEFGTNILLKGGHLKSGRADDLLIIPDEDSEWYRAELIDNPNTHGTGCTLSSAIASNLALGRSLPSSVRMAKQYVNFCIGMKLDLGKGRGPLAHWI